MAYIDYILHQYATEYRELGVVQTYFRLGHNLPPWLPGPDSSVRNGWEESLQLSDNTECFIAGGIYEKKLEPFLVQKNEIDLVQYGSDDTKTHRKIKHILG